MGAEVEELIDSYVLRPAITGDTDFFTGEIEKVIAKLTQLNSLKVKLNTDASWREVAQTEEAVRKTTDSLIVSINQYNKATTEQIQQQNNLKTAYTVQNGTMQENARALALVKAALKENTEQQALYLKGLAAGEVSMDEYLGKTAELILAQNELKQSQKELNASLTAKPKTETVAIPVDDPTNANIPFTSNLEALRQEQEAATAAGIAVNDLEKEQAAAANEATAWGASQKQAAVATESQVESVERFVDYTERLAQSLAQAKLEISGNVAAQKELREQFDAGAISEQQLIEKTAPLIVQQKELQVQTAALNKELTAMAKADFAPTNSIDELRARNELLTQARNRLTTAGPGTEGDDAQRIADLNTINGLLDQNNQRIRENADAYLQQKINIGNYPQAFKIAFTSLEEELTKVNALLAQEGTGGGDISKLVAQQTALKNALGLVDQEFSSTTARQTAFKEAGKEIGSTFGTNSDVFKMYAQNVAQGSAENKKLADSLSDAGNKGSALTKGLSSIFSSLRQIAYILPGIGIAGLLSLLIDPIIEAISKLDLFKTEVGGVADILQKTNDVLSGTQGATVKAIEDVDNLRIAFDNAEKGVISKDDAVKLYNDTLGKTAGAVDTLDQAEQKLAQNGEAFIKYTLNKAAAQIAAQKAAEQLFQAELTRQKQLSEFSSIVDANVSRGGAGGLGTGAFNAAEFDADQKRVEAAREARKQKAIKDQQDQAEAFRKIQETFLKESNALAAEFHFFIDPKSTQEQLKAQQDEYQKQIEVLDRYAAKQKQIADDERNTYAARRQALVSYNDALKNILTLQTQQKLLATTGSQEQGTLVYQQQLTALTNLEIASQDRLKKLDESYYQRRIKANYDALQAELQDTVKTNEAIYSDESKGLDERLDGYKAYVQAQKGLIDAEYSYQLARVGFSDKEIAQIEAGQKVQVSGKKITNEELETLEIQHSSKMEALAGQVGKSVYDITLSYAKKQEQLANETNKGLESTQAQNAFESQLDLLNQSLTRNLISITRYNARRNALEQTYADQRLAISYSEDQAKLENLKKVQEELLENELFADQGLQAGIATHNKEEIDANQAKLNAIKEAQIKNAADIAKIQQKAAADQLALQEVLTKQLIAAKQHEKDDIEKLEAASLDFLKALFDSQYESKINELQAETAAVQQNKDKDVANEQNSLDTAQQKADKINSINQHAAQQETTLQKQINKEKRHEAEVDRIAQIATITQKAIQTEFDLAAKAASARATAALLLADPITAAYAPIAAASAAAISADEIIVAATAAAQIAGLLATSLPAYKFGGHHKEAGWAKVGDGGKNELLEFKAGGYAITPNRETEMFLPADTTIYPDAVKAMRDIQYRNFRQQPAYMPGGNKPQFEKALLDGQKQMGRQIVRAIQEKQELHIQPGFNSLIMIQQYGANFQKWVARNLNHRT